MAARFVAQMMGLELVEGPPDPGSPLGRMQALRRVVRELGVPEHVVTAAVRAMLNHHWDAMGLDRDEAPD